MSTDPMYLKTNGITIMDFTHEGAQCSHNRLYDTVQPLYLTIFVAYRFCMHFQHFLVNSPTFFTRTNISHYFWACTLTL